MLDKRLNAVLALGYFDSVHKGHQKVIKSAKQCANDLGCALVVFTFDDNLKAVFSSSDDKMVYVKQERENLLKSLGADKVVFAPVNNEFLSLSKTEFLDYLNEEFNVLGYVCGSDYRFGKKGSGDANYLRQYAHQKDQAILVIDMEKSEKQKISTSLIKKLLTDGEIERVNLLLGRAYSVSGEVFSDRKVGEKIGFPTVNIKLNDNKHRLKDGVYYGKINGYKAVINYGARPTFNLNEKLVEAHLIGFNGNLYGQNLTVHFHGFIRGIEKFDNVEKLTERLIKDVEYAKEKNYD